MRLIDKVLASQVLVPAYGSLASGDCKPDLDLQAMIKRNIGKLEIIVADNVMQYIYNELHDKSKQQGKISIYQEFPCIAPPFEMFWIEAYAHANCGNYTKREFVGVNDREAVIGALCVCMPIEDWSGYLLDLADDKSRPIHNFHLQVATVIKENPDLKWPLIIFPVTETQQKTALGQHPAMIIPIKENGEQCGGAVVAAHRDMVLSDDDLATLKPEAKSVANTVQWMYAATVSFMHCRNVLQDDVVPSKKLNKARQRRGKPPLMRYKVLNITPMSKVLRQEGGLGSGNGLAKAMHICRGHFKTFTADKPLFGKVAGRFFWPQTLRGNAERGVIVKDYAAGQASAPMDGLTDAQRWARGVAMVEGRNNDKAGVSKRNLGKTPKAAQPEALAKSSKSQDALLGMVRLSKP